MIGQELRPELMSQLHVEALLLGNITAQDAAAIGSAVQAHMRAALPRQERMQQQVVQLPEASSHVHR